MSNTFQSTLPARGATYAQQMIRAHKTHFNPRSPHGERLLHWKKSARDLQFQSTLPARGATAGA